MRFKMPDDLKGLLRKLDGVLAEQAGAEVEGFTTSEAAKVWGCSHSFASAKIGKLIRAGIAAHVGSRSHKRIDGKTAVSPVYRGVNTEPK